MNILIKTAIAGALSLGASGAFAMGLPNTNNSDLILVVDNTTTNAFYALDTGIALNTILPSTGFVSGAVLNGTAFAGLNQTIGASSGLQTFLATNPASGDGWTLEGSQFLGSATNTVDKVTGQALAVWTSQAGTTTPATNAGFKVANLNTYGGNFNTDVSPGGGLAALGGATEITNGTGFTSLQASKYAVFGGADLSAVGGPAQTLFGFTGNGGTGTLQSYTLGTATLAANGTLTFAGNGGGAPVPLPAAVWLLGSGLMGLVGVSRRRKAAV